MRRKKRNIQLRALEMDDAAKTLRWHNDEDLYETLGGAFHFVSPQAEESWLRARCEGRPDEVNLAICLAGTGEHIGNLYLRPIDWVARHAEVSLLIGEPKHRGRGYGAEALSRLIDHAFDDLGLCRVFLSTLADNVAAIRFYEKCGLSVEGRLRKHAFKHGVFKDVLMMGLCADERADNKK